MFSTWFLEDGKNVIGQQRNCLALQLFAMPDDLEKVKDYIVILQVICWESEVKAWHFYFSGTSISPLL